jgi:hypothetical protein
LNRLGRLIVLVSVATAAVISTTAVSAPAIAAPAPVIQTLWSTCRARLAAPNSVLIIGDSITALYVTDTIAQFTAAGRPVCVNAQSGRKTADAVFQLSRYKAAGLVRPQTTVVMAVGSNDTYGAQDGYMSGQVDAVQRILQHGTDYTQPVVWVDVLRWSLDAGVAGQSIYRAGTTTVNLQLWQKDAQYQNLRVAHWYDLVSSNPTTYLYDLLHPTPFGSTARNRLIISTLGVARTP